ncbi:MAG: hypothetical protein QXE79_01845 [Candidatus Bathyarchaeia archaeon]
MRRFDRAILIVWILSIIMGAVELDVAKAATGQCYPSKPTYQFGEIIVIVLSTPTGINDSRIVTYLPNGQMISFNIGKVGIGIWQYHIGPAAPPVGRRMVMLMDGSTILFTSYYDVVEPLIPPAPEMTVKTVTKYQIQTLTTIKTTTVAQFITEEVIEEVTRTLVSTVTIGQPSPIKSIYAVGLVIASLTAVIVSLVVRIFRKERPITQ